MNVLGSMSVLVVLALVGSGCGAGSYTHREAAYSLKPDGWTVLRSLSLDRASEDRILALDPERITEQEVREVLVRGPAPRVLNVHGGFFPVHLFMASFAKFLIGMGYPAEKVRHPGNGRFSHSPYEDSRRLAGLVAWYYETEGMRVMLVGHSQGGVQVVKVLNELAGAFSEEIRVWNPLIDDAEDRTFIIDPLSGTERPVVGLQVAYASVVGAGGLAMLLPNQWSMLGRLETVPDTVEEFTGFVIGMDLFGWDLPALGAAKIYHPSGTARVRNVRLPASYNHITVPVTAHLAQDQKIRDRINQYVPGEEAELGAVSDSPSDNILWAADVWHSIKKHWCLEVQRLIRAKRRVLGGS